MFSVRLTELLARAGVEGAGNSPLEGESKHGSVLVGGSLTSAPQPIDLRPADLSSRTPPAFTPPWGESNLKDSTSLAGAVGGSGPLSHSPLHNVTVTGITQDSRQVEAGFLFAAITGDTYNGEDYIAHAAEAGAAAVLCRPSALPSVPPHVTALPHEEPRRALSLLCAAFYRPQPEVVVAVTGTDGKTSTAEFTRQLWELCNVDALSIGTLGLKCARPLKHLPALSDNTTPEPVAFYRTLSAAAQQGVSHIVCEASSHGIEQGRLEGVVPRAAIFTSFTQDHLDYHGTMASYFAAKEALFDRLLPKDALSILCADYPEIAALGARLLSEGRPVITYGSQGNAAITRITPMPRGQEVEVRYEGEDHALDLPVFGTFQVSNVIAATLAVAHTLRLSFKEVAARWPQLTTIRGRLELVGTTRAGALIFVDYAHTPGALEKALSTLRAYASAGLHVVFGCGGDRDADKRPKMGAVAARLAHSVIVTDDNPRTEDAVSIRRAVMAGCPDAREIADRAEAIAYALHGLRAGDVVLIAGKGHEDYQIIGTTKYPFDDAEVVKTILAKEAQD